MLLVMIASRKWQKTFMLLFVNYTLLNWQPHSLIRYQARAHSRRFAKYFSTIEMCFFINCEIANLDAVDLTTHYN